MHDSEAIVLSSIEQRRVWRVGRYGVYGELAVGGGGSIHIGRIVGPGGFFRVVVIKRLHPQFAHDVEHVAMFLDEVRLTSRIRHLNVVSPIDVVVDKGEPYMVMEYIDGGTLAELLRLSHVQHGAVPVNVISTIMVDVLRGLHAAHIAVSEQGEPLGIIHRDVSPSNIMVGCDGIARVIDFGIAKAKIRSSFTRPGQLKGKFGYMAPEQLTGAELDCRVDVFAAGIVFWEALTRSRLFQAPTEPETEGRTLAMLVPRPSSRNPAVPAELDAVVLRALSRDPEERYQSAEEFAQAIEACVAIATVRTVSKWVQQTGKVVLDGRAKLLEEIERSLDDCDRLPEEEGLNIDSAVLQNTTLSPSAVTLAPISNRKSSKLRNWSLLLAATIALFTAMFAIVGPERARSIATADSTALRAIEPAPVTLHAEAKRKETRSEPPKSIAERSELSTAEPASERISPNRLKKSTRTLVPRAYGKLKSVRTTARVKPRDCSPPYTVDAQGIRRIKPYCL